MFFHGVNAKNYFFAHLVVFFVYFIRKVFLSSTKVIQVSRFIRAQIC